MLSIIAAITVFLALQWKNIHFTFTEANMLPDDNIANVEYNAFLDKFGEKVFQRLRKRLIHEQSGGFV